jgi:ribosomal-protein-alanine N-acetyltransferase
MDNHIIREYKNEDKEAVMNIFRLNTPLYFSADEEGDLLNYLEKQIELYYVIEINSKVVGSGGINFSDDKKTGIISWDILHPDFQGRSLGSALLKHRIEKLKGMREVEKITVRTSQLAWKFYEKSGFRLVETIDNYWAEGFDLYQMNYVIYDPHT